MSISRFSACQLDIIDLFVCSFAEVSENMRTTDSINSRSKIKNKINEHFKTFSMPT